MFFKKSMTVGGLPFDGRVSLRDNAASAAVESMRAKGLSQAFLKIDVAFPFTGKIMAFSAHGGYPTCTLNLVFLNLEMVLRLVEDMDNPYLMWLFNDAVDHKVVPDWVFPIVPALDKAVFASRPCPASISASDFDISS